MEPRQAVRTHVQNVGTEGEDDKPGGSRRPWWASLAERVLGKYGLPTLFALLACGFAAALTWGIFEVFTTMRTDAREDRQEFTTTIEKHAGAIDKNTMAIEGLARVMEASEQTRAEDRQQLGNIANKLDRLIKTHEQMNHAVVRQASKAGPTRVSSE